MTSKKSAVENAELTEKVVTYVAQDARFPSLLIIFGFACFWSCIITVLVSSIFTSDDVSHFEYFFLRFLFLFGFAFIQFFSYTGLLNRISEELLQRVIRIVVVVLTLFFLAVTFTPYLGIFSFPPYELFIIAWFFFGIASGLLLVAWGITWTQLDAERPDNLLSALNVAAASLLAVILSLFMLFAPWIVAEAAGGILFLVSLALQMYSTKQFHAPENINVKISKQRLDLFSRVMLAPLFVGISFGFVLVFTMLVTDDISPFGLVLASIAGGAIVAFLALAFLHRVPRFSSFERFIFPILGGGLLLLPFTEGALQIAILFALIADCVCYFVMHWNVLIVLSYRHNVRASYHYEQGLISPLGGIALGWGMVGLLLFGFDLSVFATMLAFSLTLVFMLILVLSIVPYASNKAVEAITGTIEKEMQDKTGSWRKRSERICEKYALTPREQEVFLLLAKGRNTEVIAKQLFISTHTVKTHMARIYRKLSINSQQELIDMVEKN